ncbi:MAG: outer membrane protein assembly factor BamE [Pseudomonadota bacterium]
MRLAVIVIGLVALIGGGAFVMINQGAEPTSAETPLAFDRKRWQSYSGVFDETNQRSDMLGGALARLSPGMSQSEVTAALGEPDDRTPTKWRYSAGPRRGFPTEETVLVVNFADGVVTEAVSTYTANLR